MSLRERIYLNTSTEDLRFLDSRAGRGRAVAAFMQMVRSLRDDPQTRAIELGACYIPEMEALIDAVAGTEPFGGTEEMRDQAAALIFKWSRAASVYYCEQSPLAPPVLNFGR